MAAIEHSIILHEAAVMLSADECRLLEPVIGREISRVRKHFENLKDILDGGEATERQQTLCMLSEERLEALLRIHRVIDTFNQKKI